jgi:hypothetical protein
MHEVKVPLGDLGINGRIILKWILKNGGLECGLDSTDSGYSQPVSSCEHGTLLYLHVTYLCHIWTASKTHLFPSTKSLEVKMART